MGFAAQDQCKIVHRIVAVVHEHLDIIQNSSTQVLEFVDGEKQGLSFLFAETGDLLLDGLGHAGFTALIGNSENGTELLAKVSHADSLRPLNHRLPGAVRCMAALIEVGSADVELLIFKLNESRDHVIREITAPPLRR